MRVWKPKFISICRLVAVLCFLSSSAQAERQMNLGFSCSGLSSECDSNASSYPPIRPGKRKTFSVTIAGTTDTGKGYADLLGTGFFKMGLDSTDATGRLKDSASAGYGDREGVSLDSFLIFRSFFQNANYNVLSSASSCKSEPAQAKLYNWVFFKGRSSQSPSLKVYGNSVTSKVAGVVKVDPATAAIFDFGDAGTGQISLQDRLLDNTAVTYTRTSGTSCSTNSEQITTSSSSKPFDASGTVIWGENSFAMLGGGANPNYAIGLPQMNITSAFLSSLSGNSFASLLYYQSSRTGMTFKTLLMTPNSTGREFAISDLSNFEDSSSGTSWGTLTCADENSPATGFCKGTLTRSGQTGNALCIFSTVNNQNVMACSAQLPSERSIPIYFLATLPTKSSVVVDSPQMSGNWGAQVCGNFTVRNLSSVRLDNFTLPLGATSSSSGAIPAFGSRVFNYCTTCAGTSLSVSLPFYEDANQSTSTSVSFVCNAPVISSSSPADQSGDLGSNVSFSISASASSGGSPSIQWQRSVDRGGSWANIAGATSSSLPVSGLIADWDDYRYRAVLTATNAKTVTTAAAKLTVNPSVITISSQPSSQTDSAGSASFSVSASVTGGQTLSYQWQRKAPRTTVFANLSNGSGVSGATTSTLALSSRTRASNDGDQYRVVVSATGGASSVNSSAATLTVTAPTVTISAHPSNQTASSGSATFSVTASASRGSVSYQWQEQISGSFGNLSGDTASTLSLTGLTYANDNGRVFRVVVSGTDGATSVNSNSATLTVNPPVVNTAPDAPSGVSGTAGNTQVSLSWTAPESDGGASITDYVVQYSSNSGGTWITFSDGVSTSTSAVVTGLANGTSYIFQVAATNSVGTGSYSNSSLGVIPRTIPGAPTSVSASPRDGAALVSWVAPSSNGGSSVTDYVIQYSSNSGSSWTTFSDGTSTSTSATVTGLSNNTAYIFHVAAVNGAGQGFYSGNTSAVTPRSSCSTVAWNSALCNRDGYCLNAENCSCGIYATTEYLNFCNNFDSTNDEYYSNVILSMHYNGPNNSTDFLDSSSYNRSFSKVGSPAIVTAESKTGDSSGYFDGASFLETAWTNSLNLGTGDFTIEAWIYPNSSSQHQRIVGIGNGAMQWAVYSGWQFLLESNGKLWLYRYDGTQNYAESTSAVTQNVWNHVAVTRQSGTLTFWINGKSAGSSSFNIALDNVNSDPLRVGTWYSGYGYTYLNGYLDELRVTKGVSRYSSNFTPTYALTPHEPTAVRGTAGNGQVSLTWSAPASIGGTAITDYVVAYSSNGGASWSTFSDGTSTNASATVTGLTNGVSYVFKVAAVNSVGTGSYSSSSSAVTPAGSGGSAESDYYSGAQSLTIGTEKQGPSSSTLTLQYANGSSGFKVWKEKDGSRVLNATGLIEHGWQKTLTRAGTAFAGDLTNASVINSICGRVCPANVFLNHSNMTTTDRCVYYDCGNETQTLDAASPSNGGSSSNVEAEDWIQASNRAATGLTTDASYYEGNIKTCADKGMRLPTSYETQVDMDACHTAWSCKNYLPTGDGIVPIWAGSTNGVPSSNGTYNWTASASTYGSNYFWVWLGTRTDGDGDQYWVTDNGVRCVLPSH